MNKIEINNIDFINYPIETQDEELIMQKMLGIKNFDTTKV
jgi:hypothetical protein